MSIQRRFLPVSACQLRIDKHDDGRPVIVGYAAVFYDANVPGTEYQLWEDVVERVMPGCFDRAIRDGDDCRALYNHDSNLILGRTKSGTCRLSVDKKGLRYEADLPDTVYAKDLVTVMQRNDVDGSSFSFEVLEQTRREMKTADGKYLLIRELNQVRLYDVSPVVYPAYTATESGVRGQPGAEAVRKEMMEWRAAQQVPPAASAPEVRPAPVPGIVPADLLRPMRMRAQWAEARGR